MLPRLLLHGIKQGLLQHLIALQLLQGCLGFSIRAQISRWKHLYLMHGKLACRPVQLPDGEAAVSAASGKALRISGKAADVRRQEGCATEGLRFLDIPQYLHMHWAT